MVENQRELALRSLPTPYSLAIRLREAGTSPSDIAQYVNVEPADLVVFFVIADAKLRTAMESVARQHVQTSEPEREENVSPGLQSRIRDERSDRQL